jgi:hypothetical protein
MKLAQY